ncbi:MAG: dihydropteroate synthase [Myxococcota bacterium]
MREDKKTFLIRAFSIKEIENKFAEIGVHPSGIKIMKDKFSFLIFYITNLSPVECNILKQEALACGAEAAVPRSAVDCKLKSGDAFISGTRKELRHLAIKLKQEPFFLKEIGNFIEKSLSEEHRPVFRISREKIISFDERPLIMGILNITPDSFSDGGRFFNTKDAIEHGLRLAEEGADIIDIGGESTRPGAEEIEASEEINRVIPVIKALTERIRQPISIDTTKSEVAIAALEHGAQIINDISGLRFDKKMAKVAAKYKCGLIVMHTRDRPKVMQKGEIKYKNLIADITSYLSESIKIATDAGVDFENIVIDPGIGFGKTAEHNIEIIKNILAFRSLNRPVLIGVSRKSIIGYITGRDVSDREFGSTSLHTYLALNGVDILRVHNVKAAIDAIKVARALI